MTRTVTAHQRRVIAAVIATGSYKEAAAQLGVTLSTVRHSLVYSRAVMGDNLTTLQLAYLVGLWAGIEATSGVSYILPRDA